MNRYFLITLFPLACICCINGKSYACNQDPVAIIDPYETQYDCYVGFMSFDGEDSYDPDGYITNYDWWLYEYGGGWTHGPEGEYYDSWNLNDLEPGHYEVELTVYDNDGGYDCDYCEFFIIEADIDDSTEDCVSYGSGIDFNYDVTPGSGWTATGGIDFTIKEWEGSDVRTSNEGTSPGEGCFEWDGNNDSDNYVPAGRYLAQLEVYHPESGPPCLDEHEFIVYGVDIVPPTADAIPYETGTDIYYHIEPITGWTPDAVYCFITDDEENLILGKSLGTEIGSEVYNWDGKDGLGNWLDIGEYTVYIQVFEGSTYASSEHTLTVISECEDFTSCTPVTKGDYQYTIGGQYKDTSILIPSDNDTVVAVGDTFNVSATQGVDMDCKILGEGLGREEVSDFINCYWTDDTGRNPGAVFSPWCWRNSTWTAPDDPGEYEITCKWYNPWNCYYFDDDPLMSNSITDTRTITVVGVDSLLPDIGTEIDDGDSNPDTKSFVVCINESGVVTVTATPHPSVTTDKLPGSWNFSGGTTVSDLVHTVDRTEVDVTELSCSCGTSSKTTKIYIIDVEITDPHESIFDPGDNEYAFDSSSSGVCNVYAEGTTGITSLNGDLEWTLTDIYGSNLTSNPSQAKGSNITFTYTSLPSSNSEFGEKTLTLELPQSGDSDTHTVEIFFARDGYNHGGEGNGTTRNWYYYWKEGGVVSDLTSFDYYDDDNLTAFYNPLLGLCIGNLAPTSGYMDITTLKNHYYQTSINSGPDGIADSEIIPLTDDIQEIPVGQGEPDAVAITDGGDGIQTTPGGDDSIVGSSITTGSNGICETTKAGNDVQVILINKGKPYSTIITAGPDGWLHSADDMVMYSFIENDDVWDLTNAQEVNYYVDASGIDYCAKLCVHELKHQEIGNLEGTDTDADGIPDIDENASYYHLDPGRLDTYYLSEVISFEYLPYADNEFLCRMAEMIPGSTDSSKDWSDTNGKQWNQCNP